jgi:hypothetical protein
MKAGEYTFANKNGINAGIGIKEQIKNTTEVKVFPNPSSGSVTIRIENNAMVKSDEVEVFNMDGKMMYSGPIAASEIKIDCSAYAKGNYIIRIMKNRKVIAQEKLVLQ